MHESFALSALGGPQFQDKFELRIVHVDNGWIIARPAIISNFLRHAKIDEKVDESLYVPKTMLALNEDECIVHISAMIKEFEKSKSAIEKSKQYFDKLERTPHAEMH